MTGRLSDWIKRWSWVIFWYNDWSLSTKISCNTYFTRSNWQPDWEIFEEMRVTFWPQWVNSCRYSDYSYMNYLQKYLYSCLRQCKFTESAGKKEMPSKYKKQYHLANKIFGKMNWQYYMITEGTVKHGKEISYVFFTIMVRTRRCEDCDDNAEINVRT